MKWLPLVVLLTADVLVKVSAQDVSPDIDVHTAQDGRISLTVHLSMGDVQLNEITWSPYRSILLSEDRHYISIASGTDVIGGIRFVDVQSGKEVVSESYTDISPKWMNDAMEYTACLWSGDYFTILERHVFRNGTVSSDGQFSGHYHGSGLPPPPLSNLYGGGSRITLWEAFKSYYDQKAEFDRNNPAKPGWYVPPKEIKELFVKLKLLQIPLVALNDRELTTEVISGIVAYDTFAISTILHKYPQFRFVCPEHFNASYRVLDYCHSRRLIEDSQMNGYTRNFLSLLKIRESTVPWLIK